LVPAIARWKRNSKERLKDLTRRLESFSGRFGIWSIIARNEQLGFASCGAWHESLRFKRLYLGTSDVKRSFRFVSKSKRCLELFRERDRKGLVLLNDSEIASNLQSYVLRVPRFVSLLIDLQCTDEDYIRSLPRDRRFRVRRLMDRGFQFEYIKGTEFCREFVEDYHLPTVRNSHGEEGFGVNVHYVESVLEDSDAEMIKIKSGTDCLLAGLCIKDGDVYRLDKTGWLRGDSRLLKEGVQIYRVWQGIQRAKELGFSQLDLGGTPPLLDDGVFNYKMRWNARLNTQRRIWGTHHLLLDPGNTSVQAFFQRHSIIVYDPENRMCVCSGKRPEELKITSGILDGISGWWRLVSPQEAKDRGLDKEPSNGMPSGWFVPEPFDTNRF
jgi:hypothetical protein